MKRIFSIIIVAALFLGSVSTSFAAPKSADTSGKELELLGDSAILIDANSGKVLYEKNAHEQHYPASTTKMITAILALENLDLDQVVTVDAQTPYTEGSRIYLEEGEQITVKELLYGMMLESANDVAVALAVEMAGSVDAFAKRMNAKAKELGAQDTHFVNPNGLHEENHVSTAYDLAMIAKYAMKNETFRKYVATYKHDIPATNKKEVRHVYNTNRLLYDDKTKVIVNGEERICHYKGILGIKTGYTSQAQGCLVAGAERNGTELIAVTMHSTDLGRFQDCITLLDYGFSHYKSVQVGTHGEEMGAARVHHGAKLHVKAVLAANAVATLSSDASENLVKAKTKMDKVTAPVKKGQKVGTLYVTAGGDVLNEVDLVAACDVAKGGPLSVIGIPDSIAKWILRIAAVIFAIVLLLLLLYVLLKRRQVRRRKAMRARKLARLEAAERARKARWEEEYWKTRR